MRRLLCGLFLTLVLVPVTAWSSHQADQMSPQKKRPSVENQKMQEVKATPPQPAPPTQSSSSKPQSEKGPLLTWMPIAVSSLAFLVSLTTLYFSQLRVSQKLSVSAVSITQTDNYAKARLRVAFTNAGNRDAAVLDVQALAWIMGGEAMKKSMEFNEEVYKRYPQLRRPGEAEMPLESWRPLNNEEGGRDPVLVKPGSISVVEVSGDTEFVGDDSYNLYTKTLVPRTVYAIALGVRVTAMNSSGVRYVSRLPVAYLCSGDVRDYFQGEKQLSMYTVHENRIVPEPMDLFRNQNIAPDYKVVLEKPLQNKLRGQEQ